MAIDDLSLNDCLDVHIAPVGGRVAQQCVEVGGIGDKLSSGFGAFFGDSGSDDDGLTGEVIAIAGNDGVVARQFLVGEIPGGEPCGVGEALAIDDEGVTVNGVEAEAKIASEADGPEVVEGADENGGAFAELGEAGFGRGGDAEGFVVSLKDGVQTGERDDVGQGEEAGLAQAEVEGLGELGMLDGLGGIGVFARIAGGLAEA